MIGYNEQLKLQAYLDGELPERQRPSMADWLARDPEAAALLTELRQTRAALLESEAGVTLPESREFYWSKIQREIRRQGTGARESGLTAPWFVRLRRFLVPTASLALLVTAGLLAIYGHPGGSHAGMETALQDSAAFTYHDYSSGTTLVWLSYPAEKEIASEDEVATLE